MKSQELPPVGTKVYHFEHGWGKIIEINHEGTYPIEVMFNSTQRCFDLYGKYESTYLNPALSLTEYNLVNGGFTPISEWNKPKPGDVGYFWDDEKWDNLSYGLLCKRNKSENWPYESFAAKLFKNFSKEVPEWYQKKIEEFKSNLP